MDQEKILFTGGSGLLGSEMKKIMPDALYPTRAEFDVEDMEQMNGYLEHRDIGVMVHAAAFTSPPKVEEDPVKALEANIKGTANVVRLCREKGIKLIYISTDYVFKGDKGNYKEEDPVLPVNKYAWSKLGGECAVRLYDNSLIIRTTFGPVPFPYEKAFVDQWTGRESVKDIAQKIAGLIDTDVTGVLHVCGDRKTVYEYAKKISPEKDIKELSRDDVTFNVPKDTSLDCRKYNNIIKSKGR